MGLGVGLGVLGEGFLADSAGLADLASVYTASSLLLARLLFLPLLDLPDHLIITPFYIPFQKLLFLAGARNIALDKRIGH